MKTFLLLLASVVAPSSAFTASIRPARRPNLVAAAAAELNQIDEMCIENVAEFCLEEQCDVEEYEALINQLEEQHVYFEKHVRRVEGLLFDLKHRNDEEDEPQKEFVFDGVGGSPLGLW
mmetsp:Transcript_30816/g.73416  ORF Transcript_30816/g.73416 Transcript_30816/m.73416 type:complete len:119 (+) Transcript_30816:343-699(+)